MIVRPANHSDWEKFSSLARDENWRVPQSELQLFQGPWAHCAHVLDDDGFCGLATAVAYEKSAWIGNLIVPQNLRGKGYGSQLFRFVFEALVAQGIDSVWLTASEQGRSIYEREGFVAVDAVARWVLPPRVVRGSSVEGESSCEKLMSSDRFAWSEDRELLLYALCRDGKVFTEEGSVALLQAGPDVQIVGPWYAHDDSLHAHQALLKMMIASADPNIPVVVDLLASSPVPELCNAAGFQFVGRTSLMAYGDLGSADLKRMVSLASLGSVG